MPYAQNALVIERSDLEYARFVLPITPWYSLIAFKNKNNHVTRFIEFTHFATSSMVFRMLAIKS